MAKKREWIISGKLIKEYFWHIILYTVVVSVMLAAGYLIGRRKVWMGTEPWYPMLHWLNDNWPSVLLIIFLVGYVIITCIHLYMIARMLEKVTEAVGCLADDSSVYIKLPDSLHELELQMNYVMQNIRSNRQAAKEAEQRKNDLIMYMAHDLRTPLTSVIGYLTLLKDEKELTGELKDKYLGIALHKAERLEELTNEFFEITKYNFSHMLLECSLVNLSRMTEQILYEFQPLFEEKGLQYRLELEPNVMLSCDVDKLERVFDNLLKNTINYSYENSEIVVKLQKNGEQGMKLQIWNHGRTIPPEKLEHIFEQFFRMDSARASRTGGSGLGLAIAKEIVELHGGSIQCESAKELICFTVIM